MKNAASKMIWAHCATQPARNSIRHCDAVSAKHVSGFFQRQSLFYWRHNSVVSGFFTIGSKQFQSCIRIIKWFLKKCKSRLVTYFNFVKRKFISRLWEENQNLFQILSPLHSYDFMWQHFQKVFAMLYNVSIFNIIWRKKYILISCLNSILIGPIFILYHF